LVFHTTYSCIFHSCYLLLLFPLLHFPRVRSTPAISTPAFSVAPSPAYRMTRTRKTVLNRQVTTTQRSKSCGRNVPKMRHRNVRPVSAKRLSINRLSSKRLVVETSVPQHRFKVVLPWCMVSILMCTKI